MRFREFLMKTERPWNPPKLKKVKVGDETKGPPGPRVGDGGLGRS
jgi:hypothetical protein